MERLYAGYSSTRRGELAGVVAEGIRRKEFARVEPDAAATAILGVIFYRRLMTPRPFRPAEAAALVDWLLPPPAGPRGRRTSGRPA